MFSSITEKIVHIIKTQYSPYSAIQLFDLVADIESYPQFIPFCHASHKQVLSPSQVQGTLMIKKGFLNLSFTTENTLQNSQAPASIKMQLQNGPFKTLNGVWLFKPLDGDDLNAQGSSITLDLTYEIQNGFMQSVLSATFEMLMQMMVNAFCQEAVKRFGK